MNGLSGVGGCAGGAATVALSGSLATAACCPAPLYSEGRQNAGAVGKRAPPSAVAPGAGPAAGVPRTDSTATACVYAHLLASLAAITANELPWVCAIPSSSSDGMREPSALTIVPAP
eukprot:CAMPEP_0179950192 /NCGR_PEP_ID=MMETSP0983-20121128/22794_1 /TAXON_ID=483367 /ORGANISM="non described non described, Strain CCMP 2436" /LENGTH=116 /DNA_ID=CAMNT_0021860095 /DNA_START=470 /DNA_END=822 /DNA_ORIENTATION=-